MHKAFRIVKLSFATTIDTLIEFQNHIFQEPGKFKGDAFIKGNINFTSK